MKIIQLTDMHLMPSGITLYGVDPEQQLRAAVADIVAKHADADLLAITGDLCNFGDPEAYTLLRDILAAVPFEVRLMLGNHDARAAFIEAFPEHPRDDGGYIQSWLDTDHGRLLFLDSHEPAWLGGRYDEMRLAWLDKALGGAGDKPVTVFIHHPPVDCGIGHFEHIGLHDGGALMERLAAHAPGVRHLIFGHIHVSMAGSTVTGISYSSGQSCSHRFITDIETPIPWWTKGYPCYRIILLDDQGLRAYGVEVGEEPTERAQPCAGP